MNTLDSGKSCIADKSVNVVVGGPCCSCVHLNIRCFVKLLLLVQLEYDADMAFAVRRRCLLFSLCVSSPFSLAI